MDWLKNGEIGQSSKTIYSVLSSSPLLHPDQYTHPLDTADFRRCYLLLERIPEWRPRIQEMGQVSETWQNLADNWDKLTTMFLRLMATDGSERKMYDFMKELGC